MAQWITLTALYITQTHTSDFLQSDGPAFAHAVLLVLRLEAPSAVKLTAVRTTIKERTNFLTRLADMLSRHDYSARPTTLVRDGKTR